MTEVAFACHFDVQAAQAVHSFVLAEPRSHVVNGQLPHHRVRLGHQLQLELHETPKFGHHQLQHVTGRQVAGYALQGSELRASVDSPYHLVGLKTNAVREIDRADDKGSPDFKNLLGETGYCLVWSETNIDFGGWACHRFLSCILFPVYRSITGSSGDETGQSSACKKRT